MNLSEIKIITTLLITLFITHSFSESEESQLRILTGDIRHESNTFSTKLTKENDFTLIRGEEVFEETEWTEFFADSDIELIPTLHAYTRPYGVVSQEAFEKFMHEIIKRAKQAGDNPLVLERLLAYGVSDAVVAGITDRQAAEACIEAGEGSWVELSIGGKLDQVFGKPFSIEGKVTKIKQTSHNDTAVIIDVKGLHLVLLSQRRSFTRVNNFEELDIDPLEHEIVVVKLGYLFPELREIAPKAIMALTPGMAYQVIENLPYENVRRPIYPIDPDMT